ncbi:UNVERIFIED_CONTAM: AT-rich interactive domain-containing protein 3 [Sesamum calycinum]|uniref:AT-rich interactive domain-containing protein 3 n=1 Tax=Sesamum calycinum TaxID=2727403 RepID=A0AAW2PL81_9LAMI
MAENGFRKEELENEPMPIGDVQKEEELERKVKEIEIGANDRKEGPAVFTESEVEPAHEIEELKNEADIRTPSKSFLLDANDGTGDESGTEEEQAAFMKELETFHRERCLDFKPPKFYQEPLNCLKLWRAVIRLGGYEQVDLIHASGSGRARRDAAARAMQGWHSQRLLSNGEVGDPIIKKDCYEVYALVPGLLREEVRVQSDPAGRLVISGQPEQQDNPWGVTPFKKVVSLPTRIDPHQTSAVVTLHGQLFVRVPFEQSDIVVAFPTNLDLSICHSWGQVPSPYSNIDDQSPAGVEQSSCLSSCYVFCNIKYEESRQLAHLF